jgi:myo-inositol-1(or 4)-monophosphatase
VAGVIYNPIHDNMYFAAQGLGAFCNEELLAINQHGESLSDCFILANGFDRFEPLKLLAAIPVHATRLIGCATMNIAYVATGVADIYLARGVKAWDVAAGIAIVREAGGVVLDFNGEHDFVDLVRGSFVFGRNLHLATEILRLNQKADESNRD